VTDKEAFKKKLRGKYLHANGMQYDVQNQKYKNVLNVVNKFYFRRKVVGSLFGTVPPLPSAASQSGGRFR